jgi:hypothetical protein
MSRGGRGLLASPAGAVACELEPLGTDASGARYELRVTNGTDATLAATASAIRADDRRPVAALAVEVLPHASIRTGFALDAALAYERVAAEVHGDGIHLVVEAAPPLAGRTRRRWVFPAMALGAAAVLTGAVLVAVGAERPRVVDAALVASPDGILVARWATLGKGTRTYELRGASGDVIAHGTLPDAAGMMTLGRGEAATLRVAIANSFGSDARDAAYAHATAAPAIRIIATPPPRIESLAVDPLRPGAPLTVRYSAHARDVQLAIVDRAGSTWFSTTTPSGNGITQIPAPPAGPREPYTLVARAQGAGAGQETRVPIPAALAPPTPSAAPLAAATSPSRGAATIPGAATTSNTTVVDVGGGDSFSIRPDPVRAGQPFVVEIPFADGARIELDRDSDGAQITGADLHNGERSAALVAPATPGGYTVRVTLQRGDGNEILVRALRFARK